MLSVSKRYIHIKNSFKVEVCIPSGPDATEWSFELLGESGMIVICAQEAGERND